MPTVASSQQVDIKTGNTRTVVDEDGNVFIENTASTSNSQMLQVPSDNTSTPGNVTRTYTNGSTNCRHDSYTYKNNDGGNSVYTRSSTTVCQ
jgi:hypothetical protein